MNQSEAPTPADSGDTSPPETAKRGKRKSLQSGFSLLARGEPKIWFTGGMLVVCIMMVGWLVGLILYSGLPAFWPQPIDAVALNDGTLEFGQPQSQSKVSEVSNASGESIELPESNERIRRYYRTGNFDLTGRHYRWLDPLQMDTAAIGRPETAMVLERLAWGRLYGLPQDLVESVAISEETLAEIEQLETLKTILSGISLEDQQDKLQKIVELVETAIQQKTSTDLWDSLNSVDEGNRAAYEVQSVEDSSWVALTDADQTAAIQAARRVTPIGDSFADILQERLEQTTEFRDQAEHVKHLISREDAQLSELGVDIRRAELETKSQVAVRVVEIHYLLEEQSRLSLLSEQLDELNSLLLSVCSDDEDLTPLSSTLISTYRETNHQQQLDALDQQLEQWSQPLAEQPQAIADAIDAYMAGYIEIHEAKRPFTKELEHLEKQLGLAEASFAVPSSSQSLADVTQEQIAEVLAGNLPGEIAQQLSDLGFATENANLTAEKIAERMTLVSIRTEDSRVRILAASQTNYLEPDSAPEMRLQLLQSLPVPCQDIVRAVPVNQLSFGSKVGIYRDRWGEFLFAQPREANTEGGVFPAIWGTIVMTLIMSVAVVPFGVMAALYLREYTSSGVLVSVIRISINNLAGVPSIVYGVFGFSFFCYTIGSFVDGGAKNADIVAWPSGFWFIMLGVLAVCGTIAFFLSFLTGSKSTGQTTTGRWVSRCALTMWIASTILLAFLILKSPFFEGMYNEYLPNPTFGKGGLLWASLTLALLTLPVVIVATEEALAAVPNSLREGSLACGASKWQTIRRIVLPHARPGILTGAILAMARGAGEVAPLMLVGALATASELPVDGEFPFFHLDRSFMHLGFQIFTLGFQSQNSEAAKPMVFTCTLLLILIIAALNFSAIYLRARLKRRFQSNQF